MCLAPECYWCAATTAVGQLGQPGAGGVASVVGRRRRCSGRGGGCVADAPLLQTSSRDVLVLISCPEIYKVNMSRLYQKYFFLSCSFFWLDKYLINLA
jgi:hypothetical protein